MVSTVSGVWRVLGFWVAAGAGAGRGDFLLLGDEEGGGGFFLAAARAPDMRASKAEGGGLDMARRGVEERGKERRKGKRLSLTGMWVDNGKDRHGRKCNASMS